MQQLSQMFLTAAVLENLISVIFIVVIALFLFGLVAVLVRRDRERKKPKNAGIRNAASLNTQQNFDLNTEELDLDALCAQKSVRAIMNEDERALLKAYAGGESEAELAERMGVSRGEMELQISELFARLEVGNRAALLKKLQEMLREEK